LHSAHPYDHRVRQNVIAVLSERRFRHEQTLVARHTVGDKLEVRTVLSGGVGTYTVRAVPPEQVRIAWWEGNDVLVGGHELSQDLAAVQRLVGQDRFDKMGSH
jgi:hypothetical protein